MIANPYDDGIGLTSSSISSTPQLLVRLHDPADADYGEWPQRSETSAPCRRRPRPLLPLQNKIRGPAKPICGLTALSTSSGAAVQEAKIGPTHSGTSRRRDHREVHQQPATARCCDRAWRRRQNGARYAQSFHEKAVRSETADPDGGPLKES